MTFFWKYIQGNRLISLFWNIIFILSTFLCLSNVGNVRLFCRNYWFLQKVNFGRKKMNWWQLGTYLIVKLQFNCLSDIRNFRTKKSNSILVNVENPILRVEVCVTLVCAISGLFYVQSGAYLQVFRKKWAQILQCLLYSLILNIFAVKPKPVFYVISLFLDSFI